jgi:hypothetical protein
MVALPAADGVRSARVLRVRVLTLVAALLGLAAALGGCSPARLAESWRVLGDIEAGNRPSTLKAIAPDPERRAIRFAIGGRAHAADLYLPGEPAAAGIVLVPGLTPKGRNDARIVEFANTLARARFRVLVPDLVRMRALQVSADDAEPIADAIAYLGASDDADRPLGVAAVSFAVGPAVLALLEPQAADAPRAVRFVVTIGGYYDLVELVRYITTGYYREHGEATWRFRPPKQYGKWVFVLSNAARLADPRDRETLIAIAERRLDDPDADTRDLEQALGPEGRSVHALISNTDPARTPALLAALPTALGDEMAALDLARHDLSGVHARFVMIHDAADRIIPAAHSEALAAALPAGAASVYLIDSLDHAEPRSPGLFDGIRLLSAVYTVLSLRDTGPSAANPAH